MATIRKARSWFAPRSWPRRTTALLLVALAVGCDDAPEKKAAEEPATLPVVAAAVVSKQLEEARIETACNEAKMLENAAQMFVLSKQACPGSVRQLEQAGFIAHAVVDPWEQPYGLVCREQEITVRSRGPDGSFDTDDDLAVGKQAAGCK